MGKTLQTSPARNGKLDGKGGGHKGIDGWEETVMGSGVSSVRFIWCGAVLWRYGKFSTRAHLRKMYTNTTAQTGQKRSIQIHFSEFHGFFMNFTFFS